MANIDGTLGSFEMSVAGPPPELVEPLVSSVRSGATCPRILGSTGSRRIPVSVSSGPPCRTTLPSAVGSRLPIQGDPVAPYRVTKPVVADAFEEASNETPRRKAEIEARRKAGVKIDEVDLSGILNLQKKS